MKKLYIVHGWDGSPEEPLHKWLASEAAKEGFEVHAPAMPDAEAPMIEKWVPFLSQLVGVADENTYFIGHSIGCQAIIRYLETLPEGAKIGGAVFIAGWYDVRNLETEEERQIVAPWRDTPRNDEKIKSVVNKAVAIFSDNDPFVALENADSWRERVGAEIVIEHGKGHFTEGDRVGSLPSALEALRKISAE
jgi:predicted alpha/beta hydrolase family esterase